MSVEVPLPWPDELIFSAIARAKRRLKFSNHHLSRSLFDLPEMVVRPHLCGRLDFVARRLREEAGWNEEASQLRDANTLAPLVLPFLNGAQREKCQAALHDDKPSIRHVAIARKALGVTHFSTLRYCPQCRKQEQTGDDYGESYWHRAHQIPALKVCHEHKVPLHETSVSAEPDHYVALDDVEDGRPIQLSPEGSKLQLLMAVSLWEILNAPPKTFERQRCATAYLVAASRRGLAVGKPWRMKEDLRSHFSEQALQDSDAPLGEHFDDWPRDFLAPGERPPIRTHLYALVAIRLGVRLTELLKTAADTPLPERPKWPCKNPACRDHGNLVIRIKRRWKTASHWRFMCPTCLATYIRSDPLVRRSDGSFEYEMTNRTPDWYKAFQVAWRDKTNRWGDLQKCFGLSRARIGELAAQLDLEPMPGRSIGFFKKSLPVPILAKAVVTRERLREEWGRLSEINAPTEKESERILELKRWLLSYDREWADEHAVAAEKGAPPPSRAFDWGEIDKQWLELAKGIVPEAVDGLRANHPYRIVLGTVKRALEHGVKRRLPPKEKVSQTVAYLTSFTESADEARARRADLGLSHHNGRSP